MTDLQKAWAEVLMKTAQSWVYNCDSGCYAELCEREAWTVGNIMVIYQPHKSMKEYDDMYATILMKRTDKKALTAKDIKTLEPVNKAFLESYNDILEKTGNKWTHAIDGSLDSIVQVKTPLHNDHGTLKMTFEIRGATDGCCGDRWFPKKLAKWQGQEYSEDDDADETFLERCKMNATRAVV